MDDDGGSRMADGPHATAVAAATCISVYVRLCGLDVYVVLVSAFRTV